jgi:hypothetical protein
MTTIKIDPEFCALIPALSAGERAGLEADIVRDGRATVPLVVWGDVLLDGHNRFDICAKHGLAYATQPAPEWIKDRLDARIWIGRTQLCRRNLDAITRVEVADRLVGDECRRRGAENRSAGGKSTHGGPGKGKGKQPLSNLTKAVAAPVDTRAEVAEAANVSTGTVVYARAVLRATPELQAAVRRGDIAISTGAELATLKPDVQIEAVTGGKDATKAALTACRKDRAEKKRDALLSVKLAARAEAPEQAHVTRADASEFLATFGDDAIDLLITDPPYKTDVDDIGEFALWLRGALPKLAPTGRAYICCGAYPLELYAYLGVVAASDFACRSQVLVWAYLNRMGPTPKYDYAQNWQAVIYLWGEDAPPITCPNLVEQMAVQSINAPDSKQGDYEHEWQKPDELAIRFVTHATEPGALVVDPFCGTGTFLLAAAKLGRTALGADSSESMLALAERRGCVPWDALGDAVWVRRSPLDRPVAESGRRPR